MKPAHKKPSVKPELSRVISDQANAGNDVLTEDYDRLLRHFDNDSQRAAQQYQAFRERLIMFFDRRGCRDAVLEADEAFTRAARSKELEKVEDIVGFIYEVARRQALEKRRKQNREPGQLVEDEKLARTQAMAVTDADSEESRVHEIRLQCLDTCLATLPPKDHKLLLDYYREQKTEKLRLRKFLAEKLGIPIGTLRTRLARARAQLAVCCEQCIKKSLEKVK